MSWAHVTARSLLTVSVALALTLTSINAPFVSAFRSILILFAICAFGALIVATINRSQSLIDIEPENAVTSLVFFVGATIGALAWQFSLAIHFPGYFFLLIIALNRYGHRFYPATFQRFRMGAICQSLSSSHIQNEVGG